jgi:preprotein translocase subunit SecG
VHNLLTTLVTIVHIFICVMLIVIVLLQQGKGADMGATFGGGGSTLFGASGADNFFTRITTIIAVCFMLTSVFLAVNMRESNLADGSLFKNAPKAEPAAKLPISGTPIEKAGAPEAQAPTNPAPQSAAPAEPPAAPAAAPAAPAQGAPSEQAAKPEGAQKTNP